MIILFIKGKNYVPPYFASIRYQSTKYPILIGHSVNFLQTHPGMISERLVESKHHLSRTCLALWRRLKDRVKQIGREDVRMKKEACMPIWSTCALWTRRRHMTMFSGSCGRCWVRGEGVTAWAIKSLYAQRESCVWVLSSKLDFFHCGLASARVAPLWTCPR